jgi:hypothetical protein
LSYLPIGTEHQLEHPPPLHGMRSLGLLGALAFAAAFAGCSYPSPAPQTYRATIVRIEDRPGDFYSPLSGHQPLVCITLRFSNPSEGGRTEIFRVLLLGVYKPAVHGRVGDRVLVSISGSPPKDGVLDFDGLSGYGVIAADAR